jgi:hypothetical protein
LVVVLVLASAFHPDLRHEEDEEDNTTSHGSLSVTPAATASPSTSISHSSSNCFPAIGFETPSNIPSSLEGWWCDPSTEYAFVGFSYEITDCEFVHFNHSLHRLSKPTWYAQVRLHPSYTENFRIFVIGSIQDMSAYTVPATAKDSTTTSLLRPGITHWACMLLSG